MFKRLSSWIQSPNEKQENQYWKAKPLTDPKWKTNIEFDWSNVWKAELQFFKIYDEWKTKYPLPMKSISNSYERLHNMVMHLG